MYVLVINDLNEDMEYSIGKCACREVSICNNEI